ncbi:hypothetical protein GCM10017562_01190 [Streptomyces roseofulvus]|uniref:DUF6303 family protein n=1 Tax=Streptomyces roseofulvus TaxID=33902 RepID=UPI0031F8FE90
MTKALSAHLVQNPDGAWALWVAGVTDARGRSAALPPRTDLLAATDAGTLPSPADRIAALAELGFAPTADGWTWQEWGTHGPANLDGTAVLLGSIPVQSFVNTTAGAVVRGEADGILGTVPTERKRGPVPAGELAPLLGPEAAGWPELGLTVHYGGVIDRTNTQFRVFHKHRLVGFTMASEHAPGGREYRAVIHTDREGLPYGSVVKNGLPADPLQAEYDALRAFYKPGDREYPAGPYVPRAAAGTTAEGTESS